MLFTSDHGEMLGERGLWYKMNFFEGGARVPLIVSAPKKFAPRRVAQNVSLIDILPTLVDLAGGDAAALSGVDGRSLMPHLETGAGHDDVFGEYCAEGAIAPVVMIRRGRFKFIHSPVDPDQLFDLHADPHERRNLSRRRRARRNARRVPRRSRPPLGPCRARRRRPRQPSAPPPRR